MDDIETRQNKEPLEKRAFELIPAKPIQQKPAETKPRESSQPAAQPEEE